MTNVEARMTNEIRNSTSADYCADLIRHSATRVMQRCDELAACTDTPGQITRLFCTPAMKAAHEKLRGWMESAGLECRVDAAGNLIGRYNPAAEQRLLIGSHLDTVVNAGRYDGILGIMMGLALTEMLAETKSELPFAIDVIAFSEEEGVRYQTPYIGSRAVIGELSSELLANARCRWNCHGRCFAVIRLQSRANFRSGVPIRQSPCVYRAAYRTRPSAGDGELAGRRGDGHRRSNPGELSIHWSGGPCRNGADARPARRAGCDGGVYYRSGKVCPFAPGLTATIGQLAVNPNVSNVIPGEVKLSLDVRHLDDDNRDAAFREITHLAAMIAERREIEFDLTWSQHHTAVKCDANLSDRLRQAVAESDLKTLDLPSGAGHDAVIMSRKFPMAMLFIRCAGGISHHPDESVTESDVATALGVLWRFVMRLATSEIKTSESQ